MAAEGDTVPETSTNQIVDSLPVPVPPKKKMKGWEKCEMLEVLLAFQVRVLKRTGVSGSNPEQDKFLLAVNKVTRVKGRSVWMPLKHLTLRRLMSYIYGAPILDVSRSHTTTQHSR